MLTKKPMMSGIQKHILLTASFGGFGYIADKYRNDYYAERDAMYRHYISLHPEDFPEPERKKYGDLFLPWTPIR
ncbi:NADH dehydrogenase [ubiquinone] 1 subunit C2-like [Ctenocephalides felis]|nr:NADH dehydrogenase [ubiquinone] 1 subunit C2-like [Ctenocephalides felis]